MFPSHDQMLDSTEYQWYERQQAKLQADYDKGIQLLRGA